MLDIQETKVLNYLMLSIYVFWMLMILGKKQTKKTIRIYEKRKIFFSHTSYEIINTNNEVISF